MPFSENIKKALREAKMTELELAIMRNQHVSITKAREMISDARDRVLEDMEDPEEVLLTEFGLEGDYIFDLLDM